MAYECPGTQVDLSKYMKPIIIRFGRVMGQEELSNRISELTQEQFQAVVQIMQMNIEQIGSVIDQPKLGSLEREHFAGGLFWARSLLEKFVNMRSTESQQSILEPLVEI